MKKNLKAIFFVFCTFASVFFLQNPVFAAGDLNISVTPLVIELNVKPGTTTTKTIQVSSFNNRGDLELSSNIKDFYYDENDKLKFMTDEELNDPELKQFSLKNWITVDKIFSVKGNNAKELELTVTVPKDATPGGHYAMILLGKPSQRGDGSTSVGIGGQVGVMILVSIPGDFSQDGKVVGSLTTGRFNKEKKEFKETKFFLGGGLFKNGPVDFQFRYQNNSATHVVTNGNITVKNIFGGLIKEFGIENKRVFPGVSRSIYGTLEKNFMFGIYKAKLNVIDGNGTSHIANTFFIGFPLKFVLLILIVIGLIFAFFKYYNKWLINKVLQQHGKINAKKKK